jgi:hypothetical protein
MVSGSGIILFYGVILLWSILFAAYGRTPMQPL